MIGCCLDVSFVCLGASKRNQKNPLRKRREKKKNHFPCIWNVPRWVGDRSKKLTQSLALEIFCPTPKIKNKLPSEQTVWQERPTRLVCVNRRCAILSLPLSIWATVLMVLFLFFIYYVVAAVFLPFLCSFPVLCLSFFFSSSSLLLFLFVCVLSVSSQTLARSRCCRTAVACTRYQWTLVFLLLILDIYAHASRHYSPVSLLVLSSFFCVW